MHSQDKRSFLAVILALITIALWSLGVYLYARLKHIPPFLLAGLTLCMCGFASAYTYRSWRVPWRTFAVGVGGIFGYHFLFFTAFHYAPAIEVNLVNDLWQLLIVLLTPLFFSGYRLRLHHYLGGAFGFTGAALIVTGGWFQLDTANLTGYCYAGGGALVWALYSLMTKRLPRFPTAAVGGFCLFSGLLAMGVYFLQSYSFDMILSFSAWEWFLLLITGAGPMGAAFFTWDAAMKMGDPRIIGSLSYMTPFTATIFLAILGGHPLTWISVIAMVSIVTGAVVGSLDLIRGKQHTMEEIITQETS